MQLKFYLVMDEICYYPDPLKLSILPSCLLRNDLALLKSWESWLIYAESHVSSQLTTWISQGKRDTPFLKM